MLWLSWRREYLCLTWELFISITSYFGFIGFMVCAMSWWDSHDAADVWLVASCELNNSREGSVRFFWFFSICRQKKIHSGSTFAYSYTWMFCLHACQQFFVCIPFRKLSVTGSNVIMGSEIRKMLSLNLTSVVILQSEDSLTCSCGSQAFWVNCLMDQCRVHP